ncbi:hypothetical protein D1B33_12495 [Lysinibacillus yapensis]|uniref:Uncharacterized protein n=1 Tax=Ureibacillus yapensis TaxID=2304605 RepID=A0A396SCI8_9BACL|nr:hypothetical protein [Lysinibacillus yapensis]RHW35906.1 hypothetical protein D1B33_12495 [Lysinibacillus yapensis]
MAAILNNEQPMKGTTSVAVENNPAHVQEAFKKWMEMKSIPESDYRISSKYISFKIPLFDLFKEKLGETREKWWWDNGPFLFWYHIKSDSFYFTLEVGPIEADKRVLLMESMMEKGIKFTKKGLEIEAKFSRIFSETIDIEDMDITRIINSLDALYNKEELQGILRKLKIIYDETVIKLN